MYPQTMIARFLTVIMIQVVQHVRISTADAVKPDSDNYVAERFVSIGRPKQYDSWDLSGKIAFTVFQVALLVSLYACVHYCCRRTVMNRLCCRDDKETFYEVEYQHECTAGSYGEQREGVVEIKRRDEPCCENKPKNEGQEQERTNNFNHLKEAEQEREPRRLNNDQNV